MKIKVFEKFLKRVAKDLIFYNVKKRKEKKKALLLYSTQPFFPFCKPHHTNNLEIISIVDSLSDFGFCVDVAFYDSRRRLHYSKYDLIIGFGDSYTRSLGKCKKGSIKIYLSTGSYFLEANKNEIERWRQVYRNKPLFISNDRIELTSNPLNTFRSIFFSDAIFCDGGQWAMETFSFVNRPVFYLGAIAFQRFSFQDFHRNLSESKKNFICMVGKGFVHKGVDLILEAFAHLEDLNLFIIGSPEKGFLEAFENEFSLKNVHFLGFLDPNSNSFFEICQKCSFSINASCSEGCSTSVLTTMGAGIVPILSEREGVEADDFGILLDNISADEIEKKVLWSSSLKDEDVFERSKKAWLKVSSSYRKENYAENFRKAISNLLESKLSNN